MLDAHMTEMIITIIASIMASSGFWALIQARHSKKDNSTKLLVGIGHDRIVYLGKQYLSRGSITHDEYENLSTYLYEPYCALGGNGSAKKIMAEVEKLPMKPAEPYTAKF